MAAKLISGEADIAVVPSNLPATLWNKGVKYPIQATVVWGILYGLSATSVASLDDLKGQEVLTLGRGLTPDITFRHLLKSRGLEPDRDVKIRYVQESAELAPAFLVGKAPLILAQEPLVSMILQKKPDAKIFLDVQKEWPSATQGGFPQATLVVKESFLQKHPAYVAAFLKAAEEGLTWVKDHPTEAGQAAFQLMGEPAAAVVAAAIPRGNLRWVPAAQSRADLEAYYAVLHSSDPATIGGKLPDAGLYGR